MRGRILYHGLVLPPKKSTPRPVQSGKRRRCDCGCYRLYTPHRPWQRFYSAECRKNYNRYGTSFGSLKREGIKRLLKEARAAIRGEYRALLDVAIEETMHRNGWSDAKTKSIELSPGALKGAIEILTRLLRELRADLGQLEARVTRLETGERAHITDLERRVRVLEGSVRVT
jgi:hypothetical protein